jgi:hypothetical protein
LWQGRPAGGIGRDSGRFSGAPLGSCLNNTTGVMVVPQAGDPVRERRRFTAPGGCGEEQTAQRIRDVEPGVEYSPIS